MPVISLSPSFWKPSVAEKRRVDGRHVVAALCEEADGILAGIVGGHVDDVAGIVSVALAMQLVAAVLDDEKLLVVEEGEVVQAGVGDVAAEDDGEPSLVRRRCRLDDAEDAAEAAILGAGLGLGIGVAGRGEVELLEAGARAELPVLRTLEGRSAGRLGERVGVERLRPGPCRCRGW